MVKTVQDSESDKIAQIRLVEVRGKRTWAALAKELKFNQGYLNRVARGKRPASNRLRIALGLHPLHVPVDPCPTCGTVTLSDVCRTCHPPKPKRQYAVHPVMRVSRLRKLLQNPYLQS